MAQFPLLLIDVDDSVKPILLPFVSINLPDLPVGTTELYFNFALLLFAEIVEVIN
jgi:hypothetical protein